ncbi:M42 family peptidase [candidate division WOR-3 bacterium]|nr:M42 family peptidase [candidate division WOR-3 bacterium]
MELLKQLSDAAGVSGFEDEVRQILVDNVASYAESVHVDSIGNLYMSKGEGKAGPRVMFAAHTDEVGLMVKEVDDEGFVRFLVVGGIDPRVLPAKKVRLGSQKIPGVIGVGKMHPEHEEALKKIIPVSDMRIDIGASSKTQAERFLDVGAPVWFDTRMEQHGDILKGKAFDDRAGCYMLSELIREDFDMPVTFAWTCQEEVGLRGGRIAAARVRPDIVIALEGTGAGDSPVDENLIRSPCMGSGPVVTIIDWSLAANQKLYELFTETADREGIRWQYKRPLIGGTDAGAAIRVKALAAAVIAVPSRYIHSPVALVNLKDIISIIRLVKAFKGRLGEVVS